MDAVHDGIGNKSRPVGQKAKAWNILCNSIVSNLPGAELVKALNKLGWGKDRFGTKFLGLSEHDLITKECAGTKLVLGRDLIIWTEFVTLTELVVCTNGNTTAKNNLASEFVVVTYDCAILDGRLGPNNSIVSDLNTRAEFGLLAKGILVAKPANHPPQEER
jgi:hypothetical protein